MTCVPSDPRFRLLDHLVGWDAEHHDHLIGLDQAGGVRLEGGDGIPPDVLDPYIPPLPLAPGCGPCDWYLATRPGAIKKLDGCSNEWRRAWPRGCVPVEFERAVAVAVDRNRVAVADAGAGRVWVMLLKGAQIVAEIAIDRPRDLSFAPSGELIVVAEDGLAIYRFAFNGRPLGTWPAALPATPVARIAHDRTGGLWLAIDIGRDRFALYSWNGADSSFVPRSADDLAASFDRTAAVRGDGSGFCLSRGGNDGANASLCWNWFGRRIAGDCVGGVPGAAFATQGQLLTRALDSGTPRCQWHRLLIDADIPPGTRVSVAVATDEVATPAPQGVADPDWAAFPAGRPHPGDWQTIQPGQTDALIRCPPGRFLFVRLRLSGDGSDTPRVRRVHIDFPRTTSADLLPAVYREDGVAGDFTERFLALFDASLGTVDAAVTRIPALLGSARAPDEVLPWIASFLSVTLDETWDTDTRRRILSAAPDLFRRRGTRAGLVRAIRLAYDLSEDPAITEHGLERVWGAVAAAGSPGAADAHLGATRLFSRKGARLTLDASAIGRAPVMSFGDPAADPHVVGAFRFTVGLPATANADQTAVSRLVDGQKPAHTIATLRIGATTGFRLGGMLALGIDTLIARPKPRAIGAPGTRLSRNTVLGGWPPPGPVVGRTTLTSPHAAALPMICPE